MFIKYKNITNEIIIDVRSKTEFITTNISPYNIPIINEKEHRLIKKFYPLAFFIIIKSLILKRNEIRNELIKLYSQNPSIIIACSRGRLRSPIIYIYAKVIGIKKCKILLGGIKPLFIKNKIYKNNFIYEKRDS